MLKPLKTMKAYAKRIGRLGREETPVPWSENTKTLLRLWPDGTWQLPIDTSAYTDRTWRAWDSKRWVERSETREEQIAKRYAVMDATARSTILDAHALEEEKKTTDRFPHMKGRLQNLEMTTIQPSWTPSHTVMKELCARLDLDTQPVEYIADQLRAMGKLRP
ncbi:MAG TPA: hypothetical protein VGM87_09080 [Roseomonas sp.]|jgi:hypothetical protein